MGAVVSAILPPLITVAATAVAGLLHSLRTAQIGENPTLLQISDRAAQEAADAARADAEAAREEAAAARAEAEEAGRQAQEALQREQAACADAQRLLREVQDREEGERAALAQSRAEAEEAGRAARADMDRTRQALAESKRAEEDAKQRAEQAERAAEEEKRRAAQAQAIAEQAAIEANERACAAKKAQQEAEERLQKGIQPVIMPSRKELEAAKKMVQYKEGLFHFAVAGVAGGGKSSLINAFRGLRNRDIALGAAPTGVTETTLAVSRLPDPNQANPFVWYDIPGAGTLRITDWQYFHAQGLYVFDCIIIIYDSRFTMTDIAILMNCRRFNIPTYIVRSKADAHIRNVMREMGYDSEDEDADRTLRKTLYDTAREDYITETRANIKRNLEEANLPDQKVYIVSNDVLLTIVKNQTLPKKIIDELELMRDLFSEAYSRRCVPGLALA
ncbi:interferon-inducible GTPase-domain-containing protein [Melanogaster broomeanus]|nr:interferon-inducible GTPase-domain-containing protein [Melanogaster broomeanus]